MEGMGWAGREKISESKLRLLSSFCPELLKEAMIQVEKEKE